MSKNILVCIDRDGTINHDNKYYLGSQKNWKSKVKLCSGVVEGIKKLRKTKRIKIYLITNQAGVAVKNFPLLTEKKADEVCKFILNHLANKGAKLDGCEVCGHANHAYVKRKKEFSFDKKLVCNCVCIKPNPGMVFSVMKKEGFKSSNTKIYVIGDRVTDVETGLNAGGFGILVPFSNMPNEKEKVAKLKSKKKYIAKDFLDAAEFIIKKEA